MTIVYIKKYYNTTKDKKALGKACNSKIWKVFTDEDLSWASSPSQAKYIITFAHNSWASCSSFIHLYVAESDQQQWQREEMKKNDFQ